MTTALAAHMSPVTFSPVEASNLRQVLQYTEDSGCAEGEAGPCHDCIPCYATALLNERFRCLGDTKALRQASDEEIAAEAYRRELLTEIAAIIPELEIDELHQIRDHFERVVVDREAIAVEPATNHFDCGGDVAANS